MALQNSDFATNSPVPASLDTSTFLKSSFPKPDFGQETAKASATKLFVAGLDAILEASEVFLADANTVSVASILSDAKSQLKQGESKASPSPETNLVDQKLLLGVKQVRLMLAELNSAEND